MNTSFFRKIKTAWYVFFTLIILMYIPQFLPLMDVIKNGEGDFAGHYLSGKIILHRETHNFYDLETQRKLSVRPYEENFFLPNIHPPFESLLFTPFALLPHFKAYILWNIINIFLLTFCVWLLYKMFFLPINKGREILPLLTFPMLLVSAYAFYPTSVNFLNGQDSILFLTIFLLTMKLYCRDEVSPSLQSGMILGCGIFKPHLVIPLAIGIALRSKKEFFIGFFLSSFFWTLVSYLMIGTEGVTKGFELLKLINAEPLKYGINSHFFPNLRGLFERHHILTNFIPGHLFGIIFWFVGLLGIVYLSKKIKDSNIFYSLSIIIVILFSIHTHLHDLILLLFPIVFGLSILEDKILKNELKLFPYGNLLVLILILMTPVLYSLHFQLPKAEGLVMFLLLFLLLYFKIKLPL